MLQKLGREIVPGDIVVREDGTHARVMEVSNGMIRGHVHLALPKREWAEVGRLELVEIASEAKSVASRNSEEKSTWQYQ